MDLFSNTILGIDYGTQRLGLAVSRGTLAEPLVILPNDEKTFESLKRICAEENITRLVIGISEGNMAARSQAFGQQLAAHLNLPVTYFDETLSSHQVHAQQKQLGKSSPRREHIDHLAAATFLQEWLDLHIST